MPAPSTGADEALIQVRALDYRWLYGERVIRSVANNTRQDGVEFLEESARIGVKASVQTFPFDQANQALIAL